MCVYNKKNICIYVCVWGCLDKYISVATWPPQTKIPGSAPEHRELVEAEVVCKTLELVEGLWNSSWTTFFHLHNFKCDQTNKN